MDIAGAAGLSTSARLVDSGGAGRRVNVPYLAPALRPGGFGSALGSFLENGTSCRADFRGSSSIYSATPQ